MVGHFKDKRLIYAGRVGTGYTRPAIAEGFVETAASARNHGEPPFDAIPPEERRRREVRWVKPKMVIEANLAGWTADGNVRQAAFKGVREDKPPQEVSREKPAVAEQAKSSRRKAEAVKVAAETAKVAAKKSRKTGSQGKAPSRGSKAAALTPKPHSKAVRFTHPDRVYWPDVGVTKQDLADYYTAAWDWMAPHVIDRPLALVRCPDGTKGQCFFQKHASAGLAEQHLKTVTDKNKRQIIAIEDLNGLPFRLCRPASSKSMSAAR